MRHSSDICELGARWRGRGFAVVRFPLLLLLYFSFGLIYPAKTFLGLRSVCDWLLYRVGYAPIRSERRGKERPGWEESMGPRVCLALVSYHQINVNVHVVFSFSGRVSGVKNPRTVAEFKSKVAGSHCGESDLFRT
jgi:hypothetical protein